MELTYFYQDFWRLIIGENLGNEKQAVFDGNTGKYIGHQNTENKIETFTYLHYKFISLINQT